MLDRKPNVKNLEYNINLLIKHLASGPKMSAFAKIHRHWDDIIEVKYRKFCYPKKIVLTSDEKRCRLFIVTHNSATSFYFNNSKMYILDKINTYFGYKAVTDIYIEEVPMIISDQYISREKNQLTDAQIKMIDGITIDADKYKTLTNELKLLSKSVFEYKDLDQIT